MLTQFLKFLAITPVPLEEVTEVTPQVKTVATVTAMFTQVLDDLKEVQENAVANMADAAVSIKALQDEIAENAKESEKAKMIIDKIQGLLA